ncbi:DUF4360 domain-containing protein [Polyangium aurulentum]|uniref:DUF4360 domain-containing protein n=1 Tax=Polyangium aurulentum TaxID=2567896 RepID=UPI0010ADA91D|nr:DUF4360 domain-containing protein [Polyangium aurulentum]UQA62684.1 DUF4360 domain-containing protein [Polyangium aurulentum]
MLRKMFLVATAAMAGASVFGFSGNASAHTFDADVDNYAIPDGVSITGLTYGGTGCKDGAVAVDLSPDYQALTIIFDKYVAQVGQGLDGADKRKFCHLVVQLDYPAGFSYALMKLDYSGYASLDYGVKAEQKSTYFFQGFRKDDRFTFKTKLLGEFDGDYHVKDELETVSWSPCGKKRGLNVVTSVQVDNGRHKDAVGMITIDSIDASVKETYSLGWRKCE